MNVSFQLRIYSKFDSIAYIFQDVMMHVTILNKMDSLIKNEHIYMSLS
ncbi:hypothetical protein GGR08_000553 [Bartonella fuyuanensis]|uniref:Uncharacterized protein n=1 Tax=Bartonella fuyuanensis TaxID=1460968 RepID=A0A840DTG8_9HYPH|nr:hypothetical protein [Bartonella fuyuanensis]